jgi:tetratricopeptide (TPR) repeat protein
MDTAVHFERALRLSPLDPMNFNNYVGFGSSYELLGEYDKAVEMSQRGLQERPNARALSASGGSAVERGPDRRGKHRSNVATDAPLTPTCN